MKDKFILFTIKKRINVYQLIGIFSILYSLFFILTPTPAHAEQQTLRVSPVIMNVPLSPGKTINQEISIENLTNTPLPLRASLNDFVTGGEDGGYIFENSKTNPLLSWIKLSDDTFLLNPKEKKKILMTIKTPSTIPVGGYYGLLFFQPVLQNAPTQTTRVSTKVGVLMLGNLGVQDAKSKKAEVLTFTPPLLSQNGTVPFILRVKNISLNFFTAKPIITIKPIFTPTQEVKTIYLEEKLIFPASIRRWTDTQTIHNLSPNLYKLQLAVSTGNGQQIITERYIVVLPVMYILLAIGSMLLIIFLIVKRGRLSKAAAALFHP